MQNDALSYRRALLIAVLGLAVLCAEAHSFPPTAASSAPVPVRRLERNTQADVDAHVLDMPVADNVHGKLAELTVVRGLRGPFR